MADDEFKHIVRVVSSDLDGKKPILYSLRKIKGVSVMIANAVCYMAGIEKSKRTGHLSDKEVETLNTTLKDILKSEMPHWMLNRKKDPETGEDTHLLGIDVKFTRDNDIKLMKKTKSNVGFRHQWGLPVRGQRTKSNFRRNKGKGSLGVKRKST